MNRRNKGLSECFAELLGTALLVFFGVGSVHVAVLSGMSMGIWQIAIVWGIVIALAIYTVGAISGAHLNPAVTLAMAVFNRFSWRKVIPFITAQLIGAFLAAVLLFTLFSGMIRTFEQQHDIIRGEKGSERSAMIYGEYFPNPDVRDAKGWTDHVVSMPQAMLAEILGTACLLMMIMALSDPNNKGNAGGFLAPLFIGLTVAICISVFAPLTQACFNPARDFGPRIVAYLAGWKEIAIPGPRGGFFTVYILAPILGGFLGAVVYQYGIAPAHRALMKESSNDSGENK